MIWGWDIALTTKFWRVRMKTVLETAWDTLSKPPRNTDTFTTKVLLVTNYNDRGCSCRCFCLCDLLLLLVNSHDAIPHQQRRMFRSPNGAKRTSTRSWFATLCTPIRTPPPTSYSTPSPTLVATPLPTKPSASTGDGFPLIRRWSKCRRTKGNSG